MPPDVEADAEQVFIALADPSRRAILAAPNIWSLEALQEHLGTGR